MTAKNHEKKALSHRWLGGLGRKLTDGGMIRALVALLGGWLAVRTTLAGGLLVSAEEQKTWLDYVMPLPKQVAIRQKIVLKPDALGIQLRAGAGDVEKQAVKDLEIFFNSRCGCVPTGRVFQIRIGVLDDKDQLDGAPVTEAARLKTLPNREQAYLVQPVADAQLRVAALHEKGVYYGVQTLIQLLSPRIGPDRIEVPLAEILDWPDFEERGVWNCQTLVIDELAAALKLNFSLSEVARKPLERDKPAQIQLATNELAAAQRRGVQHLPKVTHLNFLDRDRGWLFQPYPELRGQGDGAKAFQYHAHREKGKPERENRVPCASQPVLAALLTDWLMGVAAAGVPECGCWLTERPAQCGCDACKADGQFVLEARAVVKAWQNVRKSYPAFTIRLFISTTTDEKYDQVLKELPAEVKVERACALGLERRRHAPRDLFRNDLLDNSAAQGRWVATYDVPITANGKVDTPEFKVPESSAHRVRDFVRQMADRKYRGLYGMPGMTRIKEVCGFNISALAEWSWNLNGRSEKEFARAWAVREGYHNPDQVAEWSELMGPVEWDVYDSGFPECYAWGEAINLVKSRTRPVCGEGVFRYYSNPEAFAQKIKVGRQALAIAEKFNRPHLANETRVVLTYIQLAQVVYQIADLVAQADPANAETKSRLQTLVKTLAQTGADNVQAIKDWRSAVAPEPWHPRVMKAVEATQDTVSGIAAVVTAWK